MRLLLFPLTVGLFHLASCASAGTAVERVGAPRAESPAAASEAESLPAEAPAEATAPPEPTLCSWTANDQGREADSHLVFDQGRALHRETGRPCDRVVLTTTSSSHVAEATRLYREAVSRVGEGRVELHLGTTAERVYDSRNEVLADAEAGPPAAAVVPTGLDFTTHRLVSYTVLHTRVVGCRDAMLKLSAAQAKARATAGKSRQRTAARLATRWMFVPDAAEVVGDVYLLDPVIPRERSGPPSGPCSEAWLAQPALTAIPRDGHEVRLLTR